MSFEYSLVIDSISKKYKLYNNPRDRFYDLISGGRFGNNTEFYALKDFSLKVRKGESIGILGKNGAGKSTLLQILAGIIEPSYGEVKVFGRISALLELGAGFNPEFTGKDNIYLSSTIYGVQINPEILEKIIEFADIGEFIDQPVKLYSSGMYVRLAFAIASQMEPDILIVDEALSVGDLQFQTKCLRLIESMRSKGCTFIFVSHSPRMVELFCDRAIWLQNGTIKRDGEPKVVVRAYENYMTGGLEIESEVGTQSAEEVGAQPIYDRFIPIDTGRNIQGKKGYVFKSIKVDISGEINPNVIDSNEFKLKVEVDYILPEKPLRPLWAIGIFNDLNQPVVHFNSDNDHVKFDCANNIQGRVRFVATVPRLRPGEYLISIGLDDGVPGNSEVLIHLYDAYKISVASSGASPQAGYVQITKCEINVE